jgi:hypothetical protein
VSNTVELAQRCNLELKLGRYVLPAFPVPAQSSEEQHLRAEAERGLAARLEHPGPAAGHERDAYHARLALELEVIVKMGFAGYFLVVADFIGWAKRNGIPVGPGAARAPARSSPTRSTSPTSTRCASTCCSSASSIPSACPCPTSTSTSAWTGATR